MEFLKTIRRRSFLSELTHIVLNIALAVAVLLIVRAFESLVPALLLVLLSKWRVFAVRPRYWPANIQANLVDVIVSVSVVVLMYSVSALEYGLFIQLILAVLYVAWLVILKPRSSRTAMVAQAATALLAGTTVLFMSSFAWPIEVIIVVMAVIGYVTARHVLTQFEEDHLQFLSLLWAFVLAQLAWVSAHWVVAYNLPVIDFRIPQATLVVSVFAFVTYRVYASFKRYGKVRPVDITLPALFGVGIVLVLTVFFSTTPIGIL